MADEANRCPLWGVVRRARRCSSVSVAAVIALMLASAPTRADDAQQQTIQKMQEQIQDLQIKLNALIAAQKATDATVQKQQPPKGSAQVVNGSDKVKLTVSGQIDRGLLVFDDSHQTNLFNVDNDISSTRLRFIGEVVPDDDLKLNANLEFDLRSNSSSNIDQTQRNSGFIPANGSDTAIRIRRASVSLTSKTFGKFTIGQDSVATDGVAEYDLSGTYLTQESDVQKLGGAMFFSPGDHLGTRRRMNQIFANFDGGRDDEIRYDTPTFYGFNLQASLAQGSGPTAPNTSGTLQDSTGRFEVALHYKNEIEGTKIEAGVGYQDRKGLNPKNPAAGAVFTNFDSEIAGSASVLFPFGLSATVTAGSRQMQNNDRNDPFTYYAKLGYLTPDPWFSFGKTAFSVEWGEDWDLTVDGDHGQVFGVAVVQNIDKWGMELFAAYRHFWVHEGTGTGAAAFPAEDVGNANMFFTGTRVKF
jgi:porin-like protein